MKNRHQITIKELWKLGERSRMARDVRIWKRTMWCVSRVFSLSHIYPGLGTEKALQSRTTNRHRGKKKRKERKRKVFSLNPNTGEEEVQWRPSREANLLLHSSGLAIHSASCSDSSDQGSPLSSQSPLLNQGTSWQTDTPTRTISICIHTVM